MTKTIKTWAVVAALAGLGLAGCKKEQPAQNGAQGSTNGTAANANGANGANGSANTHEATPAHADEAKPPEGCNSDFEQDIKTDYTLTKKCSPYTVADGRMINLDGAYLTIEPGVQIRFGENAGFEIGYNSKARLTVKGTKEEPVVFTSAKRQEAGYWRGLRLRENAAGSSIENAVVEYAGEQNQQALRVLAADVVIRGVKFKAIAGHVLDAEEGLKEFSGNDLKESGVTGVAMEVKTESLGAFKPDNVFPENTVIAFSGGVDRNVTVGPAGAPYRLSDGTVNVEGKDGQTAVLTINAGTVIQHAANARWEIGYNTPASLIVKGTKEQPVVFTSADENPSKGIWQGFFLREHTKTVSLDFAKFEWAGEKDGAALKYISPAALGRVTNTSFAHTAGPAILSGDDGTKPFEAFSGNTFEDIDGAALSLNFANANKLPADNTWPKDGYIQLTGGSLKVDTELTALTIPYRVEENVTVESEDANKIVTLTVDPGAKLQMSPDVQLTIGYNNPGRLLAKGAPDKQIVFAAATEPWHGVRLADRAKLEVENAVFSDVGEGHAGIDSSESSQGTIQNVTFKKMPVGVKECPKIKASGLKGEDVPKVEDKDC